MSATPRRVTWLDDDDLRCVFYAKMGFATQMISENTGLTTSQVAYRLRRARVYRKDYRNGSSDMAQRVIDRVVPASASTKRQILGLTPIILKP